MSHQDSRQDYTDRCENHPLRDAELVVDLPSIGVRQFLCPACKAALEAKLSGYTDFKGKREAWELELAQGCDDNEFMYAATGRQHWDRGNF